MREARRKSTDISVQEYLLKAKQEGIDLSWDIYARIQSEVSTENLWLRCSDCLQGPCSLEPGYCASERTICGLARKDLVYRGVYRFISKYCDPAWESDSLVCGCEDMTGLLNLAQTQVKKLRTASGHNSSQEEFISVGLGVLDPDYINVCVEGVSPVLLRGLNALGQELNEEALNKGAKGFKLSVCGDVSLEHLLPSVCNLGGTEAAVLTGVVDLYIIGTEGLGHGRNAAYSYHTVLAEAGPSTCSHKLRKWLAAAADAFTKRDLNRVKSSNQLRKIPVYPLDFSMVKEQYRKGCIGGICILGGGNNIKTTQDKLISEAVVRIGSIDILCLTYGNSAVTLGKYGFLEDREELSNRTHISRTHEKDALAYCIGAEKDVSVLVDMIQMLGPGLKVIGLYPELTTPWDLLSALALAGAGAKIITTTKLPFAGSEDMREEFGKLITYCEPSEFTDYALSLFGRE